MKLLKLFRSIEEQYDKAHEATSGFKYDFGEEAAAFDRMLWEVPQEYWIQ